MTVSIVIDKNVPLPLSSGMSEVGRALRAMEVGDSFVTKSRPYGALIAQLTPKRFTTRRVEGGFRVWRTA